MQKKYIFIPLIALTLLITPVKATTATPSAEPISENEITENLKKKILENLDKAKEELTGAASAKGYIGIVKDVIKDTIIVEDKDGKKDIKIKEDTEILRTPGSKAIKFENIRIDDYIIAIGYPSDNDTLIGRRLIVSTDPIKSPSKISELGTIVKIGKTSLTLKLADRDQVIDFTSKTLYKSPAGTIDLTDLAVGDTLIYTATVDESRDYTATVIMRIKTAAITE